MVPNWVDPTIDGWIGINGWNVSGATYGSNATNYDAATLCVISSYVPAAHDGSRRASLTPITLILPTTTAAVTT